MRSDEAAGWSIMTFAALFAVVLLVGISTWYFAARDTRPNIMEIEDRRPDTYVIPPQTPAPETRREIIQPPDVTIETPPQPAPQPDLEPTPEPGNDE